MVTSNFQCAAPLLSLSTMACSTMELDDDTIVNVDVLSRK
jgi:hypothetical protein